MAALKKQLSQLSQVIRTHANQVNHIPVYEDRKQVWTSKNINKKRNKHYKPLSLQCFRGLKQQFHLFIFNHNHHHQSHPTTLLESATRVMFLHSDLIWTKSSIRLYVFRSIFTTFIYILFGLLLFLLGHQFAWKAFLYWLYWWSTLNTTILN